MTLIDELFTRYDADLNNNDPSRYSLAGRPVPEIHPLPSLEFRRLPCLRVRLYTCGFLWQRDCVVCLSLSSKL
jgi:hypothetical protein